MQLVHKDQFLSDNLKKQSLDIVSKTLTPPRYCKSQLEQFGARIGPKIIIFALLLIPFTVVGILPDAEAQSSNTPTRLNHTTFDDFIMEVGETITFPISDVIIDPDTDDTHVFTGCGKQFNPLKRDFVSCVFSPNEIIFTHDGSYIPPEPITRFYVKLDLLESTSDGDFFQHEYYFSFRLNPGGTPIGQEITYENLLDVISARNLAIIQQANIVNYWTNSSNPFADDRELAQARIDYANAHITQSIEQRDSYQTKADQLKRELGL